MQFCCYGPHHGLVASDRYLAARLRAAVARGRAHGASRYLAFVLQTAQYSTWDAWCAGLRACFEPIAGSISARQKLRTWRQLGSVQDYTSGFLALCEHVGYMHEAERVDRYIGGLKPDISHEIMLRGLSNFNEILALAEKIDILRQPRPGSCHGHRPRGPIEHATIHAVAANAVAAPFKGRCFACNRPGHRKIECPKELRRQGAEQGRESQRQGNSSINTATARKLQLILNRCFPEIDARLVNGTPLAIWEKVERVKVRCGGNFGFILEMLATSLDGHDILLGRDWLRRYNPRIDWTTGSCTVRSSGNWVELPRWQSPESSTVHVNAITMKRAVAAGADVYAIDIAVVEEAEAPNKCVIVYLDDILVYSRDKQQHLMDLEAVFKILDENRLLTKGSKCEFFQDRLEFLGHVISEAGVKINPKKLDTVKAWRPPTNLTELLSFLGFVNYVRRFIPDMARLTATLTDILRKGVGFTWGEKEHATFFALKNVLCTPPVLCIADPHRPFEVITDASDIAIGGVQLQDFGNGLQHIAYESQKLHPLEKKYLIHDCEMLAIMHAFKFWRCYLTGVDVIVRADHKSLQCLRAQPHLNPRQVRWLDFLESNFHYTVTYKKGASNITDALTRPTSQIHAVLLAQTSPRLTGLFTHGYQTDPFFTGGNLQQFAAAKGIYYVKAGTDRIWVPGYTLLRELLLQEAHDGITSGHFGVEKTRQQLQRYYYWQKMLTDVQRQVASCPTCRIMKSL
ncbi:unnamed protein product [Closterium sp. NIES-53]